MPKAYGTLGDASAKQFVMTLRGLAEIIYNYRKWYDPNSPIHSEEDSIKRIQQWLAENYIQKFRG